MSPVIITVEDGVKPNDADNEGIDAVPETLKLNGTFIVAAVILSRDLALCEYRIYLNL